MRVGAILLGAVVGVSGLGASAQSKHVADQSFENSSAVLNPSPLVYFPSSAWTPGIQIGDVGVFVNEQGHAWSIDNADPAGSQQKVAFIASNGAYLDQLLFATDDRTIATGVPILFKEGEQYALTAAVCLSLAASPGSSDQLTLSFYYLDDQGGKHIIPSATGVVRPSKVEAAPVSIDLYPNLSYYHMLDFSDVTEVVGSTTAEYVGKQIGIEIQNAGQNGYFDVDNVRVDIVPEPAGLSLFGVVTLALGRRFRRARR